MPAHSLPVFSLFSPLLQSAFPLHRLLRSGLLSGSCPAIPGSLRSHCFFLQLLFVQDRNLTLYSMLIQCGMPSHLLFYWSAWFYHLYKWSSSVVPLHSDLIDPAIFHKAAVWSPVISSPLHVWSCHEMVFRFLTQYICVDNPDNFPQTMPFPPSHLHLPVLQTIQ